MSKKKEVKTKKEVKVDVNNIDEILEDMKNLVLNGEENNIVIKQDEEVVEKEPVPSETIEEEVLEEKVIETSEPIEEKIENEEITIDNADEKTEDLSFVDEIKEAKEDTITKEEVKKEKPKKKEPKMTYERMFGGTWMGYGFTES